MTLLTFTWRGSTLDVYRRQILTSKVDPRAGNPIITLHYNKYIFTHLKLFLATTDSYFIDINKSDYAYRLICERYIDMVRLLKSHNTFYRMQNLNHDEWHYFGDTLDIFKMENYNYLK